MNRAEGVRRILIVEDQPEQGMLLRGWLKKLPNVEVFWAESPAKGRALIDQHQFDALLCDIEMPETDGLAFCEMAAAKQPQLSVALMTANPTVTYAVTAVRMDIDDFLMKPLSRELVLQRVAELLARTSAKKPRRGRQVLAVGAHPDDVEIGCGGALLQHILDGDDVTILTMSEGSLGGAPQRRRAESETAADLIGARLFWGGLSDTRMDCGYETIDPIARLVLEIQPDVVYTHSKNDTHQDHVACHDATLVAARQVPNVLCYQSPSATVTFQPSMFIDISRTFEKKLGLLEVFATQAKCAYLAPELIRSTACYWGRYAGHRLVEPYEVIRAVATREPLQRSMEPLASVVGAASEVRA